MVSEGPNLRASDKLMLSTLAEYLTCAETLKVLVQDPDVMSDKFIEVVKVFLSIYKIAGEQILSSHKDLRDIQDLYQWQISLKCTSLEVKDPLFQALLKKNKER